MADEIEYKSDDGDREDHFRERRGRYRGRGRGGRGGHQIIWPNRRSIECRQRRSVELAEYLSNLDATDLFALAAQDYATAKRICFYDEMVEGAKEAMVKKYRTLSNLRRCLGDQLERQEARQRFSDTFREKARVAEQRRSDANLCYLVSNPSFIVVDFCGFPRPQQNFVRRLMDVNKDEGKIRLSNPYGQNELWFSITGLKCSNAHPLPKQIINLEKTRKARLLWGRSCELGTSGDTLLGFLQEILT